MEILKLSSVKIWGKNKGNSTIWCILGVHIIRGYWVINFYWGTILACTCRHPRKLQKFSLVQDWNPGPLKYEAKVSNASALTLSIGNKNFTQIDNWQTKDTIQRPRERFSGWLWIHDNRITMELSNCENIIHSVRTINEQRWRYDEEEEEEDDDDDDDDDNDNKCSHLWDSLP